MEQPTSQKPNLFIQAARKKLETQKSGKSLGNKSGSQRNRFPAPENARLSVSRGGRNGQGKPC